MYSYKLNNSYTIYVNYTYLNECIKASKKNNKKPQSAKTIFAYDNAIAKKNTIRIGTKVCVLNLDTREKTMFTIAYSEDIDPAKGVISDVSPIGSALLGHVVEDTVVVHIPAGTARYRILDLSN